MWLYDFINLYNGGRALLNGVSPYEVYDFVGPIFVAIFFVPFSLLPVKISYALFLTANLLLAWKFLKTRIIWALLFFPFLFALFVGQIDFLLAALILLGSPWTIALALVKPQVGFLVIPWIIMKFNKSDWCKAIISTIFFMAISFMVRPNWLNEWFSSQPEFKFYSLHASNFYCLIAKANLSLRSNITIIGALIVLPLGFVFNNRRDSWVILHTFAPLTNIYSPSVLLEWIGPIEVILSWVAVLFVGGNIHAGMPFFLIGISIFVRSVLEYRKSNKHNRINLEDVFRPFFLKFFRRIVK